MEKENSTAHIAVVYEHTHLPGRSDIHQQRDDWRKRPQLRGRGHHRKRVHSGRRWRAQLQQPSGDKRRHNHSLDARFTGSRVRGSSLTIAQDVVVEYGSKLTANARGYGAGEGPGAGSAGEPSYGGGGGYGGDGGTASTGTAGGFGYGSLAEPNGFGSGGGNHGNNKGGFGGGLIRLEVGGTLSVDGVLSANGQNYQGTYAGGGAGGGIYITCSAVDRFRQYNGRRRQWVRQLRRRRRWRQDRPLFRQQHVHGRRLGQGRRRL